MKQYDDPKNGNMVLIGDDDMSAAVMLFTKNNNAAYTVTEILDLLSGAGVKAGIDMSAVKSIVDNKVTEKVVQVAEGRNPVNGFDGHFDFNFRTELKKVPKLSPNGAVDYFELDLFEPVKEGQVIAQYTRATGGSMGFTVMGKLLLQVKGKEKPAIRGSGFHISKDGTKYYSLKTGQVEYREGLINIYDVYKVDGDVNSKTGDIVFEGDVHVCGDVKPGMKVKASGSIVVDGMVEAAFLDAGKDILIRKGSFGNDKGAIRAGGNIVAHFFENVSVKAGENIYCSSIVESECESGGTVEVKGDRGIILSGETRALCSVVTEVVGNQAGTNTIIGVGIDTGLMLDMQSYENKLTKLKSEISIFEQGIRQGLPQTERMAMAISVKMEEMNDIQHQKQLLLEKMEMASKARIEVKRRVYPGTQLRISNDFLMVPRVMDNVYFMKSQNHVATYKA
ncbi:MAG: FapA family protein [Lachnospiraceae bacterium]|nr:FapA family protein [Lachnospiraceae bacterium]